MNTTVLLLLLMSVAQPPAADDPWADAVLESLAIDPNTGFDFPGRTLGPPTGGTTWAPNNAGVASLGTAGSYLTLAFDTPVTDDPLNPMGLDCIVFSNAFWTGANPQLKWMEAAFISISRDDNNNGLPDDTWYFIPGSRMVSPTVLPAGMANPEPKLAGTIMNPNNNGEEYNWGYAEMTPTQKEYLDNYLRPDDPFEVGLSPRSGGGDAFDIAWAVNAQGEAADLYAFDFIRIWSFLIGSNGLTGAITPEIDAVADVAPAGDADGDGILDEYEVRVAGTDPTRAESTVLPLEIPDEEGGSPAGTLLGTAADASGNRITLYSAGARTGTRAFNMNVDLLPAADPGPAIPGYIKSPVRLMFATSEEDLQAALIQDAVLELACTTGQVAGLAPASLTPFRFNGTGFSAEGIANVEYLPEEQRVRFQSRYSGLFVLAGTPLASEGEGEGEEGDVWVDFDWQGAELGSFQFPFNTLSEGVNTVDAGATVHILSGTTAEVLRIDRAMSLLAESGTVRVGVG